PLLLRRSRRSEKPARSEQRRSGLAAGSRPPLERTRERRGNELRHATGERMGRVALVPTEYLVAAVADERHLHVSARRLAEEQRRQSRLVAERLVEDDCEPLEQLGPRVDVDLLVPRAVALRDRQSVGPLVVARVGEADREGAHGL